MNIPFKSLLAICVCALIPRSVCAQSTATSPALRTQPSFRVHKLVKRIEATWQHVLKQQEVKVHIQRAVPPPASFNQAQHRLEAALRRHPNASNKVALQNALADLHFAWGKYWIVYEKYVSWTDLKNNEWKKAAAHFWRAYNSDKALRPEKAFEVQKWLVKYYYNDINPQKQKAGIRVLQGMVAHYRKTQNIPALANAMYWRGNFQFWSNPRYDMVGCCHEALSLYSKTPGHLNEKGDIWYLLGNIHNSRGQYDNGLSALKKANELYRGAHNVADEISSYGDIGWIYLFNMDQTHKALEWFELGRRLCIRYPHDWLVQESARYNLTGLGYAQVKLKNYSKAIGIFMPLLAQARKDKDTRIEADCLLIIGDIYRKTKRYTESVRYCQMAATRYRKLRFKRNEARSLNWAGRCYMNLGRSSEALRFFNRALQVNREAQEAFDEADTLGALCALYAQRKQPKAAILYGKQAVNLIQIIRRNIIKLDQTTRDAFLKSNEETYRVLARVLIDEGRYNEADKVISMLKQNEFDQFVRRSSRGPQIEQVSMVMTSQEKGIVAEQDNRLANMSKLCAEEYKLQSEPHPTSQQLARLAQIQRQIKVVQDAIVLTLERFSLDKPEVPGKVKGLGNTQELLGELGNQVAQVTVFLDDKGLALLVSTPRGRTVSLTYSADGGKSFEKRLSTLIYGFVKAIEEGASTDNSWDVNRRAIELNNIFSCNGALHHQLQEADPPITTVMWRVTGVLRAVPFAALRDEHSYWGEKYRNVLLSEPSHDVVLKDKPQDNWKVLGFGVTKAWIVKGEQFPALSGVNDEFRAFANAPEDGFTAGVLPGRVLEDGKFSKRSFFGSLMGTTPKSPVRWQVIHVASHFKVSDDAEKSFLLLGDGQTMTLSDIRERVGLFRGVDLATLSACQTAQGTDSLGDLVLENGAKSVIATLWPVADKETAQLMGNFYKTYMNNREKGKAAALQKAQITLIHSGTPSARPYFWAPFVLMGNWK